MRNLSDDDRSQFYTTSAILLGIYKQVIEQVGHRPFTNSLSIFASILEYLLDAGQTPGSVFSKTTMWSYVINRRACDATFGSNHPSPRSDDLSATSSCINWPPSYDQPVVWRCSLPKPAVAKSSGTFPMCLPKRCVAQRLQSSVMSISNMSVCHLTFYIHLL